MCNVNQISLSVFFPTSKYDNNIICHDILTSPGVIGYKCANTLFIVRRDRQTWLQHFWYSSNLKLKLPEYETMQTPSVKDITLSGLICFNVSCVSILPQYTELFHQYVFRSLVTQNIFAFSVYLLKTKHTGQQEWKHHEGSFLQVFLWNKYYDLFQVIVLKCYLEVSGRKHDLKRCTWTACTFTLIL